MEPERLARIKMKDGTITEFYRDDKKAVHIIKDGIEIKLPKATGLTTTQLFSLIEPMVDTIEEEPDE
jgi:actin-like ATPase involved in cell morphogenesis